MDRTITGFHEDAEGDWVAELSCGHGQHVRHRPPFRERAWVLDAGGREARIGTVIECPLCDRAELPEGLRLARSGPQWDERSIPPGLRRAHRLAAGTWARIVVHEGALRFSMAGDRPLTVELGPGSPAQPVPPEVAHEVEPLGRVRFSVDFLVVGARGARRGGDDLSAAGAAAGAGAEGLEEEAADEQGGDPACWASLVCPECGTVVTDGQHLPGCSAAG